jgi:curved DNA-binding protein CbpA
MNQNLYQILGLDSKAEDVVVKAAYKALAQKYHPDKNPENKVQATKFMAKLNHAYDTLIDPVKRSKYDTSLEKNAKKTNSNAPSQSAAQSNSAKEQAKNHPTTETKPHDHSSKGYGQRPVRKIDEILISKILSNRIDEIEMVNLFEKLYQTSLVIHHGFANTYSFIQAGNRYKHDFSSLKQVILSKLGHDLHAH